MLCQQKNGLSTKVPMGIYRNGRKVLTLPHLKMICPSSKSSSIIISKLVKNWLIVNSIWKMKPLVEFLTNLNSPIRLSPNGIWFVKIIGSTPSSLPSLCPGFSSVWWSLVHLLTNSDVSILLKSLPFVWLFLNLELLSSQNLGPYGVMQFSVCSLAVSLLVEVPLDSFTSWKSLELNGEHGLASTHKCFSVSGTSACLLLEPSVTVRVKPRGAWDGNRL